MATLEERVAYVEGHVVLLPQMIAALRHDMDGRFDRLDGRMDRFEGRMDRLEGRVDRLEDRMSRQFVWLVGIQITTLLSTLATILGVFLRRA